MKYNWHYYPREFFWYGRKSCTLDVKKYSNIYWYLDGILINLTIRSLIEVTKKRLAWRINYCCHFTFSSYRCSFVQKEPLAINEDCFKSFFIQRSIFFLYYSIAYAFRNTHVKFRAGIRKIVEVMNFFVTSCSTSRFWRADFKRVDRKSVV